MHAMPHPADDASRASMKAPMRASAASASGSAGAKSW